MTSDELAAWQQASGQSQREFARRIGCASSQHLCMMLRGDRAVPGWVRVVKRLHEQLTEARAEIRRLRAQADNHGAQSDE